MKNGTVEAKLAWVLTKCLFLNSVMLQLEKFRELSLFTGREGVCLWGGGGGSKGAP